MALGELDEAAKSQVHDAIEAAEARSGIEFCVMIGRQTTGEARSHAEHAFYSVNLDEKPAVMMVVNPRARWIEIVTSPVIEHRISNAACNEAINILKPKFAAGELAQGLIAGITYLADCAGPKPADEPGPTKLPNVVEIADLPEELM